LVLELGLFQSSWHITTLMHRLLLWTLIQVCAAARRCVLVQGCIVSELGHRLPPVYSLRPSVLQCFSPSVRAVLPRKGMWALLMSHCAYAILADILEIGSTFMGAKQSSQVDLVVADGVKFIAEAGADAFDVIILDVAAVCKVRTPASILTTADAGDDDDDA
jgi:hypothetical protein